MSSTRRVAIGDLDVNVAVADSPPTWAQGLRDAADDDLDGMLFIFPPATPAAFNMAGVTEALIVVFFDAEGKLVDFDYMEPETGRARPDRAFRYAVELRGPHARLPGALRVLLQSHRGGLRLDP